MIVSGVIVSFLLETLAKNQEEQGNRFMAIFTSVVITILAWEGNLWIDGWLDKKHPWVVSPVKRILWHLPLSLFYSAFVIYVAMLAFNKYVCELPMANKEAFMLSAVVIGVLVSIIILSIEISTQFFTNWKRSLVEVEKYKNESLQAQLQNLKDQVNPHFLFNNMSVLSSLVYKDQDKAVDFINQMSKVYRYLLDNRNSELVSLDSELIFIRSYTYLLQIRFDTNIVFEFEVEDAKRQLLLPPMALQVLIENAIKHNEVSSEQPLTIVVSARENYLEVKNNLQLRVNKESSCKTGLQNIKDRYGFFTTHPVEVIQNQNSFIVKIPLLHTS